MIDTCGGGSSVESTGDGSDTSESDGDAIDHDCDFGLDGVDAELGYEMDGVPFDDSATGAGVVTAVKIFLYHVSGY